MTELQSAYEEEERSPLDDLDDLKKNLQDEFIKDALESGIDLREFSKKIDEELLEVENASIRDYVEESENIAALHNEITDCDGILMSMGHMLQTFQTDLGSISHEILNLQQQSVAMNKLLKNRRGIRSELSQFIDDIVVPESMIKHILETPVTEPEFLESLHMLDHKISFIEEDSNKEAQSCKDVADVLEKLKIRTLVKLREFLLKRIFSFRKPMSNYQIPQNAMLKYKFFHKFLVIHQPDVAMEICFEYINTMSKVYFSYFKAYTTRLMKLQFEVTADKDDLMGNEDNAKRGLFSPKPSLKNRSTVFTLGNRGDVLTVGLEAPILIPHAAFKSEVKQSFESLFRSQHFALVDNCCREYLFITEFFLVDGVPAQELFNNIYGRTLQMCMKQIKSYVLDCFDSIALFLSIHLINRYQLMMHNRAVPALDQYWNSLLQTMWPRFEHILQLNVQSIHDCDPQKLANIDMRPHYITRRYAEYSAGIMGINETFPNECVDRMLVLLHEEVESFILKMAAEFPARKEQLICLINNYDMMLGVLLERTNEGSKEAENFKELLNHRTQEYIEEALAPFFGGLILFVKDVEKLLENGQSELLKDEEKKVAFLISSFNTHWKKAIEEMNQDILRSFTNFKNGTNILQVGLTHLIQYYHRFQKILSQSPFKGNPARKDLLNIHHLMIEVKKYKPTF